MRPIIVAIDPDTHAMGLAVAEGGCILQAETVVPRRAAEGVIARLESMEPRVLDLLPALVGWDHESPDIVIELPRRQGEKGRRGQAIYGMAPAWIWRALRHRVPGSRIYGVSADKWLCAHQWHGRGRHGTKSKERRQAEVAARYKWYDLREDNGAHQADAILLLEWWIAEQRVREAVPTQSR